MNPFMLLQVISRCASVTTSATHEMFRPFLPKMIISNMCVETLSKHECSATKFAQVRFNITVNFKMVFHSRNQNHFAALITWHLSCKNKIKTQTYVTKWKKNEKRNLTARFLGALCSLGLFDYFIFALFQLKFFQRFQKRASHFFVPKI